MARIQRRFLLHSRWTALAHVAGSDGERHFEVVGIRRGDADAPGRVLVTLRAVLTQREYTIEVARLDDAAVWALGWQPLP